MRLSEPTSPEYDASYICGCAAERRVSLSGVSQFPSWTPRRRTPYDTTNGCGQFGTQQTGISRLVRDTADGCQPQIDGRGRVVALLKVTDADSRSYGKQTDQ